MEHSFFDCNRSCMLVHLVTEKYPLKDGRIDGQRVQQWMLSGFRLDLRH